MPQRTIHRLTAFHVHVHPRLETASSYVRRAQRRFT